MATVKVLLVIPSKVIAHEAPVACDGFVLPGFIEGLLGKRGWVLIADRTLSPSITVWSVDPKQNAAGNAISSVQLRRNAKAERAVEILTGQKIFVIGDLLIVGAIPAGPKVGQAAEIPADQFLEILQL
ncbi:hypothetical protein [Zavarzinella formosa]|uniref:hypothetical protein n=1 Tax=Zavarzinella formosa TaxID=360055 RepID=UPI0002D4F032|nr:hypothetical protein [Zavarzinella formosa]